MKITKIGQPSELARTFLQKLEESTALASQSSQTSELEVCLVNYSDSISTEDQRTIEDIIDRGLSILFLENAKEEYFPKNSLFATDSEVCIIKSDAQGRRQHMLMLGTKEQPTFIPAARENDAATMEASEEAKEKKTKEARSEEKSTTETAQDKPAIDIQHAVDWVGGVSLKVQEDIQQINASLIMGSITIQAQNYSSNLNGKPTSASAYYSYDVELAAVVSPKKNKIIKITSVNSYVSIVNGLSINTEGDRGDGTFDGRMLLYPGDHYTDNKSEISLPSGWRIIKIAPETLNNDNNYTHTTGWTIGTEGGGQISQDPNVAVNLSASYSSSDSYSQSFQDFTVLNQSNSAYCDWRYVYTKVYRDWKSIFSDWVADIENFPDLAKSTMYMKNEVVYEAPASDNSQQRFCNAIGHQTLYAYSYMTWYLVIEYGIKYNMANWHWDNFTLNMATVIFPEVS